MTDNWERHHRLMAAPCQVYRHFDEAGRLLYVGISRNARRRGYQHRCTAAWAGEIHRTAVEHFPSRRLAIDAEARAIAFEHPLYNKKRPLRAAIPKGYAHHVCPALARIYGEDAPPPPSPPAQRQKPKRKGAYDLGPLTIDWGDLADCWMRRGAYAHLRDEP